MHIGERIKKHRKKGEDAASKEIGQLHNRACFEPMQVEDVTREEKQQAQTKLTHLTEKRDKSIKGRIV